MKVYTCDSCGASGPMEEVAIPAMSMHIDARCKTCGSTESKHNREFADALWAALRKPKEKV